MSAAEIWVIDDDPRELEEMARSLQDRGYTVRTARSWATAKDWLAENPQDVKGIVLDLAFELVPQEELLGNDPLVEGLALLREFRRQGLQCPVLLLSHYLSREVIARARALYPRDRLMAREKTPSAPRDALLEGFLQRIREYEAETRLYDLYAEAGFWTASPQMLPVLREAERVVKRIQEGASFVTLLITGETGVGKEQLAQAIHRRAFGTAQGFGVVLLQTLEPEMVWVELAGAEAGAYTDLKKERTGLLSRYQTVLLDEIGDLSLSVQEKILRLVDTGKYRPLGKEEREFRGLLIFATHRDLDQLVSEGKFREDLLHRLRSHYAIHIPPLRERPEDLFKILQVFLGKPVTFTEKAREFLLAYPWPGNVRNLKTFARSLQEVMGKENHTCVDLGIVTETFDRIFQEAYRGGTGTQSLAEIGRTLLNWMEQKGVSLDELMDALIFLATRLYGSGRAQRVLGMPKSTFYRSLQRIQETRPQVQHLLDAPVSSWSPPIEEK